MMIVCLFVCLFGFEEGEIYKNNKISRTQPKPWSEKTFNEQKAKKKSSFLCHIQKSIYNKIKRDQLSNS